MPMYYVQFIDKDSKVPLTSFIIDEKYYSKETGAIHLPYKDVALIDPSLIKEGCNVNVYSLSFEDSSVREHIIDPRSQNELGLLFKQFKKYDESSKIEKIKIDFDYDKVI